MHRCSRKGSTRWEKENGYSTNHDWFNDILSSNILDTPIK